MGPTVSALVLTTCVISTLQPWPVLGQGTPARPGITRDGDVLRLRVHATGDTRDEYARQVVDVARQLLAGAGVATEWAVCVEVACTIDQVLASPVVVILEGRRDRRQAGHCGRAALGTMEGSGTVFVSVPCVAAAAAHLRRRLDTGWHPLLALAHHDDVTG